MNYFDLDLFESDIYDKRFGKINLYKKDNEFIMSKTKKFENKEYFNFYLEKIKIRKDLSSKNIFKLLKIRSLVKEKTIQTFFPYPENNFFTRKKELKNVDEIKKFIKNILKAMSILEKKNMVHRKIRPEFIYYDYKSSNYILIDKFTDSQIFDHKLKNYKKMGFCVFLSPKAFESELKNIKIKMNPLLIDIFSLGMIIILMLTDEITIKSFYNFEYCIFEKNIFLEEKEKIMNKFFFKKNDKILGDFIFKILLNFEEKKRLIPSLAFKKLLEILSYQQKNVKNVNIFETLSHISEESENVNSIKEKIKSLSDEDKNFLKVGDDSLISFGKKRNDNSSIDKNSKSKFSSDKNSLNSEPNKIISLKNCVNLESKQILSEKTYLKESEKLIKIIDNKNLKSLENQSNYSKKNTFQSEKKLKPSENDMLLETNNSKNNSVHSEKEKEQERSNELFFELAERIFDQNTQSNLELKDKNFLITTKRKNNELYETLKKYHNSNLVKNCLNFDKLKSVKRNYDNKKTNLENTIILSSEDEDKKEILKNYQRNHTLEKFKLKNKNKKIENSNSENNNFYNTNMEIKKKTLLKEKEKNQKIKFQKKSFDDDFSKNQKLLMYNLNEETDQNNINSEFYNKNSEIYLKSEKTLRKVDIEFKLNKETLKNFKEEGIAFNSEDYNNGFVAINKINSYFKKLEIKKSKNNLLKMKKDIMKEKNIFSFENFKVLHFFPKKKTRENQKIGNILIKYE